MDVRQEGSMFPPAELFFAEGHPQRAKWQIVTFFYKNATENTCVT